MARRIGRLACSDGEALITATRETSLFGDDLDLMALQTDTDTRTELLEDLRLARHHLTEVEGSFGDRKTIFLAIEGFGEEMGRVQECLRRYATFVETDTTELILLEDDDAEAVGCCMLCSVGTAGASTDDSYIVVHEFECSE